MRLLGELLSSELSDSGDGNNDGSDEGLYHGAVAAIMLAVLIIGVVVLCAGSTAAADKPQQIQEAKDRQSSNTNQGTSVRLCTENPSRRRGRRSGELCSCHTQMAPVNCPFVLLEALAMSGAACPAASVNSQHLPAFTLQCSHTTQQCRRPTRNKTPHLLISVLEQRSCLSQQEHRHCSV